MDSTRRRCVRCAARRSAWFPGSAHKPRPMLPDRRPGRRDRPGAQGVSASVRHGDGGRTARPGRHPTSQGADARVSVRVLRRHATTGRDRRRPHPQPTVLLADEPTTALDVTTQASIVELVRELRSEMGMSVIWISHDLAVVGQIADRVAVMYAGEIVELGSTSDLFARPKHPYTGPDTQRDTGRAGAAVRLHRRPRRRARTLAGGLPVSARGASGPPASASSARYCDQTAGPGFDACTLSGGSPTE